VALLYIPPRQCPYYAKHLLLFKRAVRIHARSLRSGPKTSMPLGRGQQPSDVGSTGAPSPTPTRRSDSSPPRRAAILAPRCLVYTPSLQRRDLANVRYHEFCASPALQRLLRAGNRIGERRAILIIARFPTTSEAIRHRPLFPLPTHDRGVVRRLNAPRGTAHPDFARAFHLLPVNRARRGALESSRWRRRREPNGDKSGPAPEVAACFDLREKNTERDE